MSNENPFSEANFMTLKYCPAFLGRFGSIVNARAFCSVFFDHYDHAHRHAGIGLHTPASVHYGTAGEIRAQRATTPTPPTPAASGTGRRRSEAPYRRLDQRADPRGTHQLRMRSCLTASTRSRAGSIRSKGGLLPGTHVA